MAYSAATKHHSILYDDQSSEDVDLSTVKYRLAYRLQPKFLQARARPMRPSEADVTWTSWPLLVAACAVRL
eukprot:252924-Prymnesium_polylepis.1